MKCKTCKKEFGLFRWKYECPSCNNTVCNECLVLIPNLFYLDKYNPDDKFCKECVDSLKKEVLPKYNQSLGIQEKVITFPTSYKGKIPIKKISEQKEITTMYFKNTEDAYISLRTMAAFHDYDLVYNVKLEKSSRSSGNYVYAVFRLKGIPALQDKK